MKGNNKGITLVALVITIIILIILAGISISMLLGDNGIIERAKRAAANYTIAADEEHSLLDYLNGTLEDNDVVEEARGNGTLSGEGTESSPYLIQSIEDLVYLSNQVKGGDKYTDKHFRLEISLDFKDRKSYLDPDSKDFGDINEDKTESTLYEELTIGQGFYPIGVSDYRFEGIFDGNNKSIRNIQGRSLFGYINNSTIKNLKMLDVNISYSKGGIINVATGDVIIDNCKTTGEMVYNNNDYSLYFGAIIAQATSYTENSSNSLKVYSTSNGINITTTASDTGGFVGGLSVSAEFENCSNSGTINRPQYAGGIVGYCTTSNIIVNFTNCSNTGNLTASSSAGGIVAYSDNGTFNFTDCYNIGEITGTYSCAGIAGRTGSSSNFTNCYNTGKIKGTSSGGIVGSLNGKLSELTNCYNTGDITGEGSHVGGVIGDTYGLYSGKAYLTNCYNTGDITGTTYVGGVVSRGFSGSITKCYNTGTINCQSGAGGIVGMNGGPEITYCYNSGTIKSKNGGIGGIASEVYQNKIAYCYNIGDIIIEAYGSVIGGICGNSSVNIENCYNAGNISFKSPGNIAQIGGIGGVASKNITNCYNTGKITFSSGIISKIGGIIGEGGIISNCYNIGEIEIGETTNTSIGSIVGSPSSITSCYYLDGTYEKATGGSNTYDVTAVENEDSMKSTMNTKFATIEGWKISTTGGYPELEL